MDIVALAGGVGGAKLVDGLARRLPPDKLTVIVNNGDDFEHFGLKICPDLDTICYTLAGIANPETGWGRAGESWEAIESLALLGGPAWFRLGDRDLGTHLERTRLLAAGWPLSEITKLFCKAWGVGPKVLPMSDDRVATKVLTDEGELPFQEYFVKRHCEPKTRGFRFEGHNRARPAPGVIEALETAEIVLLAPSNPWVSIDPILSVEGIRAALAQQKVLAVSPIVGGKAIKGPAAKMYRELGVKPSATAVAKHYHPFLTGFILDKVDAEQEALIAGMGIETLVTQTVMTTTAERIVLAQEALSFAERILSL